MFIETILSDQLIYAIGWVILHSFWQGAALSFIYGLLSFLTQKSRPEIRYALGITTLFLMGIISIITFIQTFNGFAILQNSINAGNNSTLKTLPLLNTAETLIQFMARYFNENLPLVVFIWFLGILILTVRFMGGFLYCQRIRVHQVKPAPTKWQQLIRYWQRKFNLSQSVSIMESPLIKAPMTFGHFKPIIFFPIGLLTGLPVDQIEALIAHELAHIIRKDYLINIFQNCTDIFYFYNPAMIWISSQIRMEREHCCDDMAISITKNSLSFAKALANIESDFPLQPSLAVKFGHSKYKTYQRIRRVTKMQKKGTNMTEKLLGACVLGLFLCIAGISLNATHVNNQSDQDSPSLTAKNTAAKKTKQVIMTEMEEKELEKLALIKEKEEESLARHSAELEENEKKLFQEEKQKEKALLEQENAEHLKAKEMLKKEQFMRQLELEQLKELTDKLTQKKEYIHRKKSLTEEDKENLKKIDALLIENKNKLVSLKEHYLKLKDEKIKQYLAEKKGIILKLEKALKEIHLSISQLKDEKQSVENDQKLTELEKKQQIILEKLNQLKSE